MPRALAAVALAGVLAVLVAAALDTRERAFAVGLPAIRVAGEAASGAPVCHRGIDVPAGFDRVRLVVGTFGTPGPPLDVRAGRALGRVGGGYRDGTVEAHVGPVRAGGRIDVCVEPAGPGRVAILGAPPDTPRDELERTRRPAVAAVVFARSAPPSMLALVPEAFRRAGRFMPGGAGLYWVLLVAVGAGLPAALWRAAASSSSSPSSRDS